MPRLSSATFPFASSRTAAMAVGLALLLSGCQGGSAPDGSPSQTGSTTPSPTSSPAAPAASAASGAPSASAIYKPADAKGKAQNVPVPVMPELAKENSKAGLEAFIGYYYAVGNYADETGDISGIRTLTTPDCKACTYYQKAAVDGARNGRWIVGGKVRIPKMEITWNPDQPTQQAKVQVVQEAIAYYNSDGSEGRPADAATNDAFIVVASFASAWKVVDTGVIR
ncbi:DUF6318 family protein [Paenarthrobacter sp. CM16]|jgi:hypothetical protein|uniref:DUF6318 family protein n=1 Tax=Paenarthrobacter sp. CM16 TaxID=2738447 RepID=UPI0020A6A885|nr:DUF6318 family protein [Paenarthrobacter sp. CM16]